MLCVSTLGSLGLGLAMTVRIMAVVESSHAGSDEAAIQAASECAAVTEALGTPLEEAWGAPGCGSYEGGGGHAIVHVA